MNEKEKVLKYIKDFSKINVTSICRKLNIDRANLLKGKTTLENLVKVKVEIQKSLIDMIEKNK